MQIYKDCYISRYNCDGTTYNGCGGHVYGDSGTLDALDDDKCQWMIRVDDGFAVEISVITFDVSSQTSHIFPNQTKHQNCLPNQTLSG